MKISFYVEGGKVAGMGHLRRSEALALIARERGHEVEFLQVGPEPYDWLQKRGWQVVDRCDGDVVFVDSYIIPNETVDAFAARSPLAGFHDKGEPDLRYRLLVSSVYGESVDKGRTRIVAGPQYRILHPEVLASPRISVRKKIERAVVTFGGSELALNLSRDMARQLAIAFPSVSWEVVAGMTPEKALMAYVRADVAVCGGGQTLFELAYLGVPTVVVELSEDQHAQIQEAVVHGFTKYGCDIKRVSNTAPTEVVRELESVDVRNAMHAAGTAYVDGKGATRIIEMLEREI